MTSPTQKKTLCMERKRQGSVQNVFGLENPWGLFVTPLNFFSNMLQILCSTYVLHSDVNKNKT